MGGRHLLYVVVAGLAVLLAVPAASAAINRGSSVPQDQVTALAALGSGFTYQGRLTDAGAPANGTYDLRFILYDAETGGTQVGATVDKADVAVQNGLFSTVLDFGATSFDGNARWLEIAIRPGASAGTHTVLSPRQAINPVPYATYAKAAGGFALPFSASSSSASATSLLGITQTGEGTAISGGAATGTAGRFSGEVALELDGPLKVSGTNATAFQHVATQDSIDAAECGAQDQCTLITNPLLDGDPNALVFVTQIYTEGEVYNPHPVGVWYDGAHWEIFNEDVTAMPEGASFNVLVIKR